MEERWEVRSELDPGAPARIARVALLSVHTCPLDQAGTGDSGGMNVYVLQAARRLSEMGVAVDIFTRWSGAERVREPFPGVRVIHLEAGPAEPVPKEELIEYLCPFYYAWLKFEADEAARLDVAEGSVYDVVHSHYWMSGWVARHIKERWGIPFVQSFHTLAKVKNLTLAVGDEPEPASRITAEERIVESADVILAPTASEARELVAMYGANSARISVVSPGVDVDLFDPSSEQTVPASVQAIDTDALLLFVGRLQPLKAPEVAVRVLADATQRRPDLRPALLMVGGPSGAKGTSREGLQRLAEDLGVGKQLHFAEPMPHEELRAVYRAADVVVVPSRTESFGLVALEAAASGVPVVASDVGGLRTVVRDGETGILVPAGDVAAFGRAIVSLLVDPEQILAMRTAALRYARLFDWRRAAAGLLAVYELEVQSRTFG